MRKQIKNLILIGFLFTVGFLLAYFLFKDTDALILDNEFLITFVGVVLGISATIITFIYSSSDKIWKVISNTFHDDEPKEKAHQKFKLGYAELVEDSSFIFIIFILLIICIISYAIDIPYISFPNFLPKSRVLNSIKMGLFLNCLAAICDLFFSLSNILRLILFEKRN